MKTILIADDEEDARTIICMRLAKDRDVRIVEATNGREALALAKEQHPDLVVLIGQCPA
jgi:CheY-like chemotaxis protein